MRRLNCVLLILLSVISLTGKAQKYNVYRNGYLKEIYTRGGKDSIRTKYLQTFGYDSLRIKEHPRYDDTVRVISGKEKRKIPVYKTSVYKVRLTCDTNSVKAFKRRYSAFLPCIEVQDSIKKVSMLISQNSYLPYNTKTFYLDLTKVDSVKLNKKTKQKNVVTLFLDTINHLADLRINLKSNQPDFIKRIYLSIKNVDTVNVEPYLKKEYMNTILVDTLSDQQIYFSSSRYRTHEYLLLQFQPTYMITHRWNNDNSGWETIGIHKYSYDRKNHKMDEISYKWSNDLGKMIPEKLIQRQFDRDWMEISVKTYSYIAYLDKWHLMYEDEYQYEYFNRVLEYYTKYNDDGSVKVKTKKERYFDSNNRSHGSSTYTFNEKTQKWE